MLLLNVKALKISRCSKSELFILGFNDSIITYLKWIPVKESYIQFLSNK
jgi:hypothetical protein